MRKTMLCAIDCDAEEREALRAGAERAGLPLVFASWGEWTAVPRGACVSVRHAMRVDETGFARVARPECDKSVYPQRGRGPRRPGSRGAAGNLRARRALYCRTA